MTENIISFPNVGIELKVNETAFTLFGVDIKWYALILSLGIIVAVAYVLYRAKQQRIPSDCIIDYAIFTVIFGIVGARLYYVLTTIGEYDSLWDMINIRRGGLAIYGAIIGGALAIVFVARAKKMKILNMFDIVAPAVMLGQIIGRWGNFMNGEAFGDITDKFFFFGKSITLGNCEKLPWIMNVTELRNGVAVSSVLAHPTFLYESLWNLVGFILINVFYKKKKFNGQVFYAYIAWYGLGRMFIEGLRSDSLLIGSMRISQLLAAVCVVVGTVLLFVGSKLVKDACGEPRADEIAAEIAERERKYKEKKAARKDHADTSDDDSED